LGRKAANGGRDGPWEVAQKHAEQGLGERELERKKDLSVNTEGKGIAEPKGGFLQSSKLKAKSATNQGEATDSAN